MGSTKIEFSIIYLTYRPGGIDVLADSLANQTVKDYELIVVDNYSMDRRAAVKSYLKKRGIPVAYVGQSKPHCFPELVSGYIPRLEKEPGVMNAMNTGLLLSTKEVVIILTDYIWLAPDWLERITRHADLLRQNYLIVLGGQMWENEIPRNNQGIISVWEKEWKGSPEENGCWKSFFWMPEGYEFSCTAVPWTLLEAINGFPECLDAYMAHPLDPIIKKMQDAKAKVYVDRGNLTHMINHREWQPAELWHQAKRQQPKASVISRENCFALKKHVRGKAYWLKETKKAKEQKDIFDNPEYWCGNLGYRPGPDGIGYRDFPLNQIKVDYIMERHPKGKILDVGCAMGYLVGRLRAKGIDAWGVDISQYAINHAPDGIKPYLKVASADAIPFKDNEFDIVFSASTLEHLPPDIVLKAISEIKRVGHRGIIAVTPGTDPHFDEDATHRMKQSLSWWRVQFPPEFEVRSDADEAWLKTRQLRHSQMHRIEWVQSRVSLADSILEVGCAENPVWKGTSFNVTTIDKAPHPDYKPDFIGEAEQLPFKDKEFDIVSEGELLEHVFLPQAVLKEAVRVAKKKVVLTVPWEHVWTEDLKPFWNPGHVRFYTPETLEEELGELGLPFSIEAIRIGNWAWLGAEIYCGKEATAREMVKLNLGSFVDVIPGWENIDILALRQYIPPEIKFRQWDLRRGIPYPDNSVDLIRASHLIEHFTLEEAHKLGSEIYRILKPGGFARISTPDARLILRHYMNHDMSFFNQIQPPEYILAPTEGEKLSRILFSGDYSHKAVYDFGMLKNFLHQAGFELGKVYLVAAGFSRSPAMQQEAPDQHEEVSLIVEAIK